VADDTFPKLLNCVKDEKQMKVTMKAWNSTEHVALEEVCNDGCHGDDMNIQYRKLMGMIYVFDVKPDGDVVLVTFHRPANGVAKGKEKQRRWSLEGYARKMEKLGKANKA
jgi:hypothetical protein